MKSRKTNCTGHILRSNCLLKQEESVEVTENGEEDVSSYWITLSEQQEIEGGRTRLHSVEISFWKRVWTCPKTDSRMNEGHLSHVVL
jgi:hypothetical protein